MSEINDMAVAQETVDNMQAILEDLRTTSEKYELPVMELHAALEGFGITTDVSARVYAMIKQLLITTSHVITNESDPQQLVSNLYSLNVANMLFYKQLSSVIPDDIATDVLVIVSSILFQLESGSMDEVQVDSELPEATLTEESSSFVAVTKPEVKTFVAVDDEIAGIVR